MAGKMLLVGVMTPALLVGQPGSGLAVETGPTRMAQAQPGQDAKPGRPARPAAPATWRRFAKTRQPNSSIAIFQPDQAPTPLSN